VCGESDKDSTAVHAQHARKCGVAADWHSAVQEEDGTIAERDSHKCASGRCRRRERHERERRRGERDSGAARERDGVVDREVWLGHGDVERRAGHGESDGHSGQREAAREHRGVAHDAHGGGAQADEDGVSRCQAACAARRRMTSLGRMLGA
jgi:hypothetical protein